MIRRDQKLPAPDSMCSLHFAPQNWNFSANCITRAASPVCTIVCVEGCATAAQHAEANTLELILGDPVEASRGFKIRVVESIEHLGAELNFHSLVDRKAS